MQPLHKLINTHQALHFLTPPLFLHLLSFLFLFPPPPSLLSLSFSHCTSCWTMNELETPHFSFWLPPIKPPDGLPKRLSSPESACQCRRCRRHGFDPLVGKISWRRKWQPTPIFLPGESHGQRSLVGYGLWGHEELDMTEWLSMLACSLPANHQLHQLHQPNSTLCDPDPVFCLYCSVIQITWPKFS